MPNICLRLCRPAVVKFEATVNRETPNPNPENHAHAPRPMSMRAARITAPRRIEIESVPVPAPSAGQVCIRLEGCGVCGSNLAVWQGRPWFQYPLMQGAPGHEGWGRISAVGDGVANFHVGARVAFLSDRSFSEYALADARSLVAAPRRCEVFPGEALGCAVNVFRRSRIERDQNIAVIGSGFLGALLIQLAARAGARVFALSRRPFAREIARRAGAAEVFGADHDSVARILCATAGEGCERVIEAAGTQDSLDLASRLIKVRGRMVIAGYHQDGSRQVDMQLWNWRGIDVINAHERSPAAYLSGMSAAADLIEGNALDPSSLYTHRFALDRLPDAFEMLEQRPAGFLKGWIGF